MKRNQVRFSRTLFNFLHQFIIDTFLQQHPGDYPEYALYGYNDEKKEVPSIRKAMIHTFEKQQVNIPKSLRKKENGVDKIYISGKYLRDKFKSPEEADIEIHKDYLDVYLLYIGFEQLKDFEQHLLKEGFIESLEQTATTPVDTPLSFNCYYFNKKGSNVRHFKLHLSGPSIKIDRSPAKYKYVGVIKPESNPDKKNLCFYLTTQDAYANSEFALIINSAKPLAECIIATGHYYETDGSSGSLIIEKGKINQVVEQIKNLPWLDKESYFYEEQFALLQNDLGTDNWKTIEPFFSRIIRRQLKHKFLNRKITSNLQLSNEITRIKEAFYSRLLYRKQINHKRTHLHDYAALEEHLNVQNPGWENNQYIQSFLANKYVAYVAGWKRDEFGTKTRYIEQVRIDLHENGSALMAASDAGTFKGYYNIVDQRIAMIRLKKVGSDACYYLILSIPKGTENSTEPENNELIITGVMGGISTEYLPRAEKVLLHKLSDSEVKEVYPRFYIMDHQTDALAELRPKPIYKHLRRFFSLQSDDGYFKDGNFIFSNILNLPEWDEIGELAGNFYYYRVNQIENAVRRYPMRISPNGDVSITRKDFSMKGKVHLYKERAIVHLFDNGQKGYDGTLFFQFPKSHPDQMKGIMLSASNQDECFSNLVWIRRADANEELQYLPLRFDDHPKTIEEINSKDPHFIKATYLHFCQPSAILTDELELLAIHQKKEEEFFVPNAISKQLDEMILLYLRGNDHIKEAQKKARRMVNGWNCTAQTVSGFLKSYQNLDQRLKDEIINMFKEMANEKAAELEQGDDSLNRLRNYLMSRRWGHVGQENS